MFDGDTLGTVWFVVMCVSLALMVGHTMSWWSIPRWKKQAAQRTINASSKG